MNLDKNADSKNVNFFKIIFVLLIKCECLVVVIFPFKTRAPEAYLPCFGLS